MTVKKELKRFIISDKQINGGLPVFRGTRIPVYVVFEYLSKGWTIDELKEVFPNLEPTSIRSLLGAYSEYFKKNYAEAH